jgi:hypothetical protein
MVDQQDDERVKGHSFLIENILSREEKSPKTADRPTQITMAHITGQPEHSPRITDIQGIQFFFRNAGDFHFGFIYFIFIIKQ